MGTSTRQASPSTLSWQAVGRAYASPDFPPGRVVEEIWRAARIDPDSMIPDLGSPLVFAFQEAITAAESPTQLVGALNRLIARSKVNTFGAELAKRAALGAMTRPDRLNAWREQLFTQATDYMASRDLSGYVGRAFRSNDVPSLVEFKRALLNHVRETVRGVPHEEARNVDAWRAYVGRVATRLSPQDQ